MAGPLVENAPDVRGQRNVGAQALGKYALARLYFGIRKGPAGRSGTDVTLLELCKSQYLQSFGDLKQLVGLELQPIADLRQIGMAAEMR